MQFSWLKLLRNYLWKKTEECPKEDVKCEKRKPEVSTPVSALAETAPRSHKKYKEWHDTKFQQAEGEEEKRLENHEEWLNIAHYSKNEPGTKKKDHKDALNKLRRQLMEKKEKEEKCLENHEEWLNLAHYSKNEPGTKNKDHKDTLNKLRRQLLEKKEKQKKIEEKIKLRQRNREGLDQRQSNSNLQVPSPRVPLTTEQLRCREQEERREIDAVFMAQTIEKLFVEENGRMSERSV